MLIQHRDNPKEAIIEADRSITYRDLCNRSLEISRKLEVLGVCNECVILYASNSIDYVVAYFGILMSMNVVVPMDRHCTQSEVQLTLHYCDSHIILCEDCFYSDIM